MVCFGCCTQEHGTPTTQMRYCSPSTPSIPPGCSTSVSRIRLATAPGWPFGSIFRPSRTGTSMWEQRTKLMSTACCLKRKHANAGEENGDQTGLALKETTPVDEQRFANAG